MPDAPENKPMPRTLRGYFALALAKRMRNRPVSFYLLLSIPFVLLLTARMGLVKEDPKAFVFFLSMLILFLGAISARAVLECFDIARANFRERENLLRETLGQEEFLRQMQAAAKDAEKDE